jgi:hypothetical protein
MYGQIVHARNASNDMSEVIHDSTDSFSDSQFVTQQTQSDRRGNMSCDVSENTIHIEQQF